MIEVICFRKRELRLSFFQSHDGFMKVLSTKTGQAVEIDFEREILKF